jgi:putative ABC transport system substrate-binding protein
MKNSIKKIILLAVLMPLCAFALFQKQKNVTKIYVCKVIEHEAINSVVSGMKCYLDDHGIPYELLVESGQGNIALTSQIITKFVKSNDGSMDGNVVVTIGTMPSQCAFNFAKKGKIKLIFSSVTNPDDISKKLNNTNTTGVSNFVAIDPQIELFKKIQPSMKNLGIIYNTGEQNSVSIVKILKSVCKKNNINLVEQGISRISDITQVCKKLSKKVDAIFISNDNMVLSGIANIISICNDIKIPVYVSDTDQVEKGCLAALGPNQHDIGMQTAEIIEKVTKGEDINSIEVEYPKVSELFINLKSADYLGIVIPDDIISNAKKVIR